MYIHAAACGTGQHPELLCALLCQAEAQAAQGLNSAAAASCAIVLQRHPGHKVASLTLSKVLRTAGRPEQAAEVVSSALLQEPDVELLEQRGNCLLDQGQLHLFEQ
jgi:predicted Zn-dependent protease